MEIKWVGKALMNINDSIDKKLENVKNDFCKYNSCIQYN